MRALHMLPPLTECTDQGLRTWAEQVGGDGGRVFYHAHASSIEAATHAAASSYSSIYEVVTDGWSVQPFFDLEYSTTCDPLRNCDDAMLTAMLECIYKVASEALGVGVQRTIVLDSSNTVKFSLHVTVHLHNSYALRTIKDAQCFAQLVVALLPSELHHITSSSGAQQSVVDLKVYKRNQQFRILGCVKHGDSRVLRLHRCMHGSVSLLDTLMCVQPSNLALSIDSPSPDVQAAHHTSAAYGSAAAAYMPKLVMVLTSTLGCRIYSMQTHAGHASASPAYTCIQTCYSVQCAPMPATTLSWKCAATACSGG